MASDSTNSRVEHLENEVRSLKSENEVLRQQNSKLRAELETCNDVRELLIRKLTFPQVLLAKNLELVTLRDNIEHVMRALNYFRNEYQQAHTTSHNRAMRVREVLLQVREQRGLARIAQIILNITDQQLTITRQAFINSLDHKQRLYGLTQAAILDPDPHRDPVGVLQDIARLINESTLYLNTVGLLSQAYGEAYDPRSVAGDIVYECDTFGAPSLQTIRRLPLEWIISNLPDDPPRTHDKLHEALALVGKFHKSKLSLRNFVIEIYGTDDEKAERTLKKYLAWYDKLVEFSLTKPDIFEELEKD